MRSTYRDDLQGSATTEIKLYDVVARGEAMGWEVELAEVKGRPFILFRALAWGGVRPRLALFSTDAGFVKVLLDLHTLGRLQQTHESVDLQQKKEASLWFVEQVTEASEEAKSHWERLTSSNPPDAPTPNWASIKPM